MFAIRALTPSALMTSSAGGRPLSTCVALRVLAEVASAEVPQAEKDELFCCYAAMILQDLRMPGVFSLRRVFIRSFVSCSQQ